MKEIEMTIDPLTTDIVRAFKENRKCYGTRRIRKALVSVLARINQLN